jgi:hypothetical protein
VDKLVLCDVEIGYWRENWAMVPHVQCVGCRFVRSPILEGHRITLTNCEGQWRIDKDMRATVVVEGGSVDSTSMLQHSMAATIRFDHVYVVTGDSRSVLGDLFHCPGRHLIKVFTPAGHRWFKMDTSGDQYELVCLE